MKWIPSLNRFLLADSCTNIGKRTSELGFLSPDEFLGFSSALAVNNLGVRLTTHCYERFWREPGPTMNQSARTLARKIAPQSM